MNTMPQQAEKIPSLSFYYRSADKALRKIVASHENLTLEEGFKAVMEHLHKEKEVFLKPILCILKGGK